jgi:hypothetical protein
LSSASRAAKYKKKVISIKCRIGSKSGFEAVPSMVSSSCFALVFPLQFGYASLFGDIFQLVLGHLQLRLEAESVELPIGHGGVMVGLRGVVREGLTDRCRGWVPLNQPETRMIVKIKGDQR